MVKLNLLYDQTRDLFERLMREEKSGEYLQSLREFHAETYEHALRVCLLSMDLGFENGLNQRELRALGYAGLLHDIGKTRIPQDILTTAADLDSQQYEIIQGHVRLGFLALQNLEDGMVKEIVVAHHEFTRKPYPRNGVDRRQKKRPSEDRRQAKTKIRAMAQIVAIADMADALMQARTYKAAYSKKATEEMLRRDFTGEHKLIDQVLRRFDADRQI